MIICSLISTGNRLSLHSSLSLSQIYLFYPPSLQPLSLPYFYSSVMERTISFILCEQCRLLTIFQSYSSSFLCETFGLILITFSHLHSHTHSPPLSFRSFLLPSHSNLFYSFIPIFFTLSFQSFLLSHYILFYSLFFSWLSLLLCSPFETRIEFYDCG